MVVISNVLVESFYFFSVFLTLIILELDGGVFSTWLTQAKVAQTPTWSRVHVRVNPQKWHAASWKMSKISVSFRYLRAADASAPAPHGT